MIRWIRARVRLRRIEKATKVKLMKKQRKKVLCPKYPMFEYSWGRGSGKTMTAVFWTLLWRKEPINFNEEYQKVVMGKFKEYAIPDPDITNGKRLDFVMMEYRTYSIMCTQAGVDVCSVQRGDPRRYPISVEYHPTRFVADEGGWRCGAHMPEEGPSETV